MGKGKKAKDMTDNSNPESAFVDTDFFVRYSKAILYSIVAVMLVLLLVYRIVSSSHTNAERDYLSAEADYSRLYSSQDQGEEFLSNLQDILNRRVELHPKYDGLIAQALLKRGDLTLAKEFATLALKRVGQDFRAYYGDYSENTLLIYEGKFEEALERAKTLKTALLKSPQIYSTDEVEKYYGEALFAYNLLRIAMLEQEVGRPEAEREAWEELIRHAGWDGTSLENSESKNVSSVAYQQIWSNFRENGITLLDYIKERQQSFAN
ncbi:MAG: tetratricopeptide (TPR) repeat protein [Chlamydiales bacterium]|jgi:tetratricopeptide (TPR) repeat protein